MGTRARVNVMEGNSILVSIYRQYDGYPSGLGRDVAAFVAGLTLVNGLSGDRSELANGMGCLAAQLIKSLKQEAGNVYIRDTGPESQGEEYVYTVYDRDGKVRIRATEGSMTAFGLPGDTEAEMTILYDGTAAGFLKFARKKVAA
jgi:hypothetical protein